MKLSTEMKTASEEWLTSRKDMRLWADRVKVLEDALVKIERKARNLVPQNSTRASVLTQLERLAKKALDEAWK